jgi:mannose PTS system EIIA component
LAYQARFASGRGLSGAAKRGYLSVADAHPEPPPMIGLVIVTHGGLASEFLSAMEHVVGPQRGVAAICIGPEDDMERRRRDIVDAAAAVDDGSGVILLTDMFGGTPSNLAISVMEQTHAEVIAGLNLPMLIKLASVRTRESLETCVAHAQDAGRKYISVASWVLAGEK